jgi:poly(A) polymerase
MIRAAKFAARLDFQFEPETYAALLEVAPDIVKCSKARVLEEIYKLLRSGSARRSFELLLEIGLFEHILGPYLRQFGEPDVAKAALLAAAKGDTDPLEPAALLWRLLGALDRYISQTDEAVINGVLQAVLFAPMVGRDLAAGNRQNLDRTIDNRMGAVGAVLGIARRDRELARQILMAHQRLIEPAGRRKRSASMASRQYFHDALVFLAVWVDAIGDGRNELAQWQRMAQAPAAPPPQGSAGSRGGAGPGGGGEPGGGRKRRRRGGRGRGNDDAAAPEPAADGAPEAHVDGT